MEDFAVVIILIIVGILSSVNKKKKKAQKAAQATIGDPVMPDAPEGAQAESVRASKEAQFDKDMRAARQRTQEKRAAQKAAQSVPVAPTEPGTMLPPRPVAPVVDHDAIGVEGGTPARPSMQPRIKTDAPAPLEAMEGVDPCHDALYDEPRAELDDDYEPETLESSDAAQELMRGIILSEVLARPSRRWRTQHR